MIPQRAKNTVHKVLIATLTLIFILMLLGAGNAEPRNRDRLSLRFPGGKRGQEAITALQDRLPQIASRYHKHPEKLRVVVDLKGHYHVSPMIKESPNGLVVTIE